MNIFKKLNLWGIFKKKNDNNSLINNKTNNSLNNNSSLSIMNQLLSAEKKWKKVNTPSWLERKKKKKDKLINIDKFDFMKNNLLSDDENDKLINMNTKKIKKCNKNNRNTFIKEFKVLKNKFTDIRKEIKNHSEIEIWFNKILEKIEKN